MNRTDKKIIMGLLSSQQSMYQLEKSLKESNYATVYRHIKKMQKEGLLKATKVARKNGKQDNRGTEKPELTPKGLATLIIDGDLKKEELCTAARLYLKASAGDLSASFLLGMNVDEVFANTFLKMRKKVNLRFFDEDYFNQLFVITLVESFLDERKKMKFPNATQTKKLKEKFVNPALIGYVQVLQKVVSDERARFDSYFKFLDAIVETLAKGGN